MKFIAQTQVPENSPTTIMAYPERIISDSMNMTHLLIGTQTGNIYFYSIELMKISSHRIGR